jgi:hypothetical protein
MHVVTDLRDVHAFHFTPVADLVFVPNEEVRAQAMRHGLIPDRLAVAGYPIQPDFVSRLQAGPETRSDRGRADPFVLARAIDRGLRAECRADGGPERP